MKRLILLIAKLFRAFGWNVVTEDTSTPDNAHIVVKISNHKREDTVKTCPPCGTWGKYDQP